MIFKEASSLAASLGDGGEGQWWGMGLPQNRASQEQRTQTRLDSGEPDFQKKANSNLGQEGVLGSPGSRSHGVLRSLPPPPGLPLQAHRLSSPRQ